MRITCSVAWRLAGLLSSVIGPRCRPSAGLLLEQAIEPRRRYRPGPTKNSLLRANRRERSMQNGNVRFPQDENFISLAGMTALGQILSFKRGRYYSSLG